MSKEQQRRAQAVRAQRAATIRNVAVAVVGVAALLGWGLLLF